MHGLLRMVNGRQQSLIPAVVDWLDSLIGSAGGLAMCWSFHLFAIPILVLWLLGLEKKKGK
jgi:hypothetical protein